MSTPASMGRLLRSRGTTPGAGRAVVVVLCSMTGPIRRSRRLFARLPSDREAEGVPALEPLALRVHRAEELLAQGGRQPEPRLERGAEARERRPEVRRQQGADP